MINSKSTKTGMEKTLDGLRTIRACIIQNAPRVSGQEIAEPYDRWLKQLDVDIAKATKWLAFGTAGGNLDNTSH